MTGSIRSEMVAVQPVAILPPYFAKDAANLDAPFQPACPWRGASSLHRAGWGASSLSRSAPAGRIPV
jgi:hypothetical protein